MPTQLDAQLGLIKEVTYGTPLTVNAFYPFVSESLTWMPEYAQGAGMRVGRRLDRADRDVLVKQSVGGEFTTEGVTRNLGKLFEAALGVGVSTQIGATIAYQQLFTPTQGLLPSYTIQKGLPPLGGGAASPTTFTGMVCSGFELSADNAGIPTITFPWVGRAIDTVTGLAAASYPANVELYSFVHGSIRLGGAVTVPTATALATGGTATANIRSASLSYDNGLDSEGFNFGGLGLRSRRPEVGKAAVSGQLTVEYDNNVLRDAWLAGTQLSLVLTYATTNAIVAASFPTLQIVIPSIRLRGDIPQANGGDVVTQSIDFTAFDGGVAAQPVYVAIVTAETAI